jgi:hypothetical protein
MSIRVEERNNLFWRIKDHIHEYLPDTLEKQLYRSL